MIIDVSKSPYYIKADGKTDNATALMKLRAKLEGPGKPHYTLLFPAGEVRSSNNRWLLGIQSFELVGHNTTFRSIYTGDDEALQRPIWVGEMFQNNVLTYTGKKEYQAGMGMISADAGQTKLLATDVIRERFNTGDRILIYGFDQVGNGYPPGVRYFEWNNILDIIYSSLLLTLKYPLSNSYSNSWLDNPDIAGHGAGEPRILNLDRLKNPYCKYAKFTGITIGRSTAGVSGNFAFPAERLEFDGCDFGDGFLWISECRQVIMKNCIINACELDKIVGSFLAENCIFNCWVNNGGSINDIILLNCQVMEATQLNSRNITISGGLCRSNQQPDPYAPAISPYPARNPVRNYSIASQTFTASPDSKAESLMNPAPFDSMIIDHTEDGCKDILIPFIDHSHPSGLPLKMMEAGVTTLFKEDGSNGGLVTDLRYDSGKNCLVISGTWNTGPVKGERWVWCHVANVIDAGSHRNLTDRRLWDGNSIRYKGNTNNGPVKEMHLNQDDFKWVKGGNGNITVDLYGYVLSLDLIVRKPYAGGMAVCSIEDVAPYNSIYEFDASKQSTSIGNVYMPGAWIKQLTLNTFNVTGDVTPDTLPAFDIIIKWRGF